MTTINNTRKVDKDGASTSFAAIQSALIHSSSTTNVRSERETYTYTDLIDVDVSGSKTTKTDVSATLSNNHTLSNANKSFQMDDILFVSTFKQNIPHSHDRRITMSNKVSDCDTGTCKY